MKKRSATAKRRRRAGTDAFFGDRIRKPGRARGLQERVSARGWLEEWVFAMSAGDRVLLRLYAVLTGLGAIWLGLWLGAVPPVPVATNALFGSGDLVWLIVYVLVIFLLSVRFVLIRKSGGRHVDSYVKVTESGEIRISHATVSDLARRAARLVRGVEKLQAAVGESPEGLVVSLRVRAQTGVDLTQMSDQLQAAVIDAIRGATSLTVHAVHVQIAGLAPESAGGR